MTTIALISQKGGAGKTTIALDLAVTAVCSGDQCAVIDIDPQASAKCWHDLRQDDTPVVVSAQAARLPEILQTARQNRAALVIIDTAPHSESAALAAARLADLVLVPCRSSLLDLKAITTTIDLSALAKTPALAVPNTLPVRVGLKGSWKNLFCDELMVCYYYIDNRIFIGYLCKILSYEIRTEASIICWCTVNAWHSPHDTGGVSVSERQDRPDDR